MRTTQPPTPATGPTSLGFLGAATSGKVPNWPADWGLPGQQSQFLEAARQHGVQCLLYRQIQAAATGANWPLALRSALADELRGNSAAELLQRKEIIRVLAQFQRHGLEPLLLKGAALAYLYYPVPGMRPRCDTDLLLPPDSEPLARSILKQLGYRLPPPKTERLLSRQFNAWRQTEYGRGGYDLDIHLQLSNRELFSRALVYGELRARAIAVPKLGPHALTLSPVDALLFACMHRVGHLGEGEPERLLWLYDIQLLARQLTPEQQLELADSARNKQLLQLCRECIETSAKWLDSQPPEPLRTALAAAPEQPEPSAGLLSAGPIATLWQNLQALPSWGERLGFLRELCFPASAYMLQKFPGAPRASLPLLYLWRGLNGILKRMRRRSAKPSG